MRRLLPGQRKWIAGPLPVEPVLSTGDEPGTDCKVFLPSLKKRIQGRENLLLTRNGLLWIHHRASHRDGQQTGPVRLNRNGFSANSNTFLYSPLTTSILRGRGWKGWSTTRTLKIGSHSIFDPSRLRAFAVNKSPKNIPLSPCTMLGIRYNNHQVQHRTHP
jgi:hypothetical protein